MDLQKKLERYPLCVANPSTGPINILVWWAHSSGHHLIMSPNPDSIERLFRETLERNGAEPKEYWVGRFVSPPDWLKAYFAEYRFTEDVASFRWNFIYSLNEYRKYTDKLPPIASLCTDYKYRYADEDTPEEELKGTEDPEHAYCTNCSDQLVVNFSFEELFDRYDGKVPFLDRGAWESKRTHGDLRGRVSTKVESRAASAAEGERLFVALGDFGHHSRGAYIEEVVRPQEKELLSILHRPVLFFFQGEKVPVPEAIFSVERSKEKEWEDSRKKDEEEHERRNQQYRADFIQQAEEVFEELSK